MSWKAAGYVKQVFAYTDGRKISRTDKFILLMIADYYNDDQGAAWPSTMSLANDCLISQRHLLKALNRLEAGGLLAISRGRGGSTSRYGLPAMPLAYLGSASPKESSLTPKVTELAYPKGHRARLPQKSVKPISTVIEPLKNNKAAFMLPAWIPADAWEGYLEMRGKIKRPMTVRAKGLAVRELDRLRPDNDPEAVLNQSVLNCWQGLFPLRRDNGNGNGTGWKGSKPSGAFPAPPGKYDDVMRRAREDADRRASKLP